MLAEEAAERFALWLLGLAFNKQYYGFPSTLKPLGKPLIPVKRRLRREERWFRKNTGWRNVK